MQQARGAQDPFLYTDAGGAVFDATWILICLLVILFGGFFGTSSLALGLGGLIAIVASAALGYGSFRLRSRGLFDSAPTLALFVVAVFYAWAASHSAHGAGGYLAVLRGKIVSQHGALTVTGQRFHDAYMVLASAAFTLTGLFFIAVRNVGVATSVKLVVIAELFAGVFTLALAALLFQQDGWWRLFAIAIWFGGSFVYLLRIPRKWIVDYGDETAAAGVFWYNTLYNRRNATITSMVGVVIMPIYPVIGELIFVTGLATLLLLAGSSASYLYLYNELASSGKDPDELNELFRIKVTPSLARSVQKTKESYERLHEMRARARAVYSALRALGYDPPPPPA